MSSATEVVSGVQTSTRRPTSPLRARPDRASNKSAVFVVSYGRSGVEVFLGELVPSLGVETKQKIEFRFGNALGGPLGQKLSERRTSVLARQTHAFHQT